MIIGALLQSFPKMLVCKVQGQSWVCHIIEQNLLFAISSEIKDKLFLVILMLTLKVFHSIYKGT